MTALVESGWIPRLNPTPQDHARLSNTPSETGVGRVVRAVFPPASQRSLDELDLLDAECRGFLMALEQRGVLDAEARERVIERALALEQSPVDLNDLKWVVLLVLYNTPNREAGYAWMESELLGAHLRHN